MDDQIITFAAKPKKPTRVERAKRKFNALWSGIQSTKIGSGYVLVVLIVTNLITCSVVSMISVVFK